MADPDPPKRPSDGPGFVTSGARAPRKPKIEVLQPGPPADAAAPPEPSSSGKGERPPELMRGEPSGRTPAPAPEANQRNTAPAPEAQENDSTITVRRKPGFPLDFRTLLLGLLVLGVLAALFGFAATQRGQDIDAAGIEDAVKSESIAFPDDTDRYYADENSGEEQKVASADVIGDDRLVGAKADDAPAQGMRVDLPGASPEPVERRPTPTQPRTEARSEPRQTSPAERPAPEREDAAPAATSTNAVQTVGAFYAALGEGDGASAASLVVPSKRRSGPLSAGALTRYFSSFQRPLRVQRVTAVDEDSVRVAYDYVLPGGRNCRGTALVDVTPGGQISRIRTQGPC